WLNKHRRRAVAKFCRVQASRKISPQYSVRRRIERIHRMNNRGRILAMLYGVLLAAPNAFSQESSSKPSSTNQASEPSAAPAQSGPAGALSKILTAACSQNQLEFTRYLTVRNKDAFSRMTPTAHVALMKRFVLLND